MRNVVLGAVAYDAKVVPIWQGFRAWFAREGLGLDFILYANYEQQALGLLAGQVDLAWNSPLAWIRCRRLAEAQGAAVSAMAMRDTDRDLTSLVIARSDSPVTTLSGLAGLTVATGAVDSPQATLLPVSAIRQQTKLRAGVDFEVRRFDVGVGLHGDHIGGERDAAIALQNGDVDAACLTDSNLLLFAREGTLRTGSTRVIGQTGPYDHCNMTVGPSAPQTMVVRFAKLLLSMSYSDPFLRPLLDMEGLKEWRVGRTEGYQALERAVDETGFYDERGEVHASDYRP
jgi:phosphonate transport system substrate-binding protein